MREKVTWVEAARECYEVCGTYVCWKGEAFDCPECGEPIYRADFPNHDFMTCPICDYQFFDDEESEE